MPTTRRRTTRLHRLKAMPPITLSLDHWSIKMALPTNANNIKKARKNHFIRDIHFVWEEIAGKFTFRMQWSQLKRSITLVANLGHQQADPEAQRQDKIFDTAFRFLGSLHTACFFCALHIRAVCNVICRVWRMALR
jgi:hypothetical protein